MKKWIWRWGAAFAAALTCGSVWAEIVGELEGVPIDDSATVGGFKVMLNGAAVRKRGYFKTDVTTLYLSSKRKTLDGVYRAPGAKRIQLTVLRDLSGSTISKYFISDFKLNTTEEEFKELIPQVSALGDYYSHIPQVNRGDIVNIDWVPGRGIYSTINGKTITTTSSGSAYMNSEKMYEIFLRMYIGARASSDYRNGLLGVDTGYLKSADTPAFAKMSGKP